MTNDVAYTAVDLNATGTATVYNPDGDTMLGGVVLEHGGSTAVVQLEVTDGTDTAVLTPNQSAGDGIAFAETIPVTGDETVQVNVTTPEGSALSETCGAFTGG